MTESTSPPGSIRSFILLEFVLSIPFWGIGALAQAHVIPDQVMLRASWSLTPMAAALILVYRQAGVAGLRAFFGRILDYRRVKAGGWYLAVFLMGPGIVFTQYAYATWSGLDIPAPHLTLLLPLSFLGFFLIAWAEELGWTVYALDGLQRRQTALTASILVGVIWASMHAPVWAFAGQSLEWCLWQWLYVIALRVLMGWVYNNAGKSLFAMDLLHPGLFVWWYLWPVGGTGLSMPTHYDPRSLALIALALATAVSLLWGRTFTAFVAHRRAAAAVGSR